MSWMTKENWNNKDIIKYYVQNEFLYKLWGPNMHYGFWEKGIWNQRQASLRFNEKMAELAGITKDDVVLDAGCGVGGYSIFLAKTFGCKVHGITITPRQVDIARRNAEKAGVSDLVTFHEMDYLNTEFENETFTKVCGLESVCYAESKKTFIAECHRILKKGGRVVVADGFASREEYEGQDKKLMDRWLDGWLVNSLDTPGQFESHADHAGFESNEYHNITKQALPTSIFMFVISLPLWPLHLLDKIIPIKGYPADALFHQYPAMRRGLWEYGMFAATK